MPDTTRVDTLGLGATKDLSQVRDATSRLHRLFEESHRGFGWHMAIGDVMRELRVELDNALDS